VCLDALLFHQDMGFAVFSWNDEMVEAATTTRFSHIAFGDEFGSPRKKEPSLPNFSVTG
jgi:hypothetical protein